MTRDMIIECLKTHAQGMIAKHRANVEIYLSNPAGIGEHSDVMEAIEIELDSVAKYNDRLEMINKYIKDHNPSLINQND